MQNGNVAQEFVRHTLATLAYRAAKAVRGAPAEFVNLKIGTGTRTPAAIVVHMGDLMEWALTMVQGQTQWRDGPVQSWDADLKRLFAGIKALDDYLAGSAPVDLHILHQLFQGPIADALTHTGQLTMLRRLAGSPIRGESYQRALIAVGQTGLDQPPPQREFD